MVDYKEKYIELLAINFLKKKYGDDIGYLNHYIVNLENGMKLILNIGFDKPVEYNIVDELGIGCFKFVKQEEEL